MAATGATYPMDLEKAWPAQTFALDRQATCRCKTWTGLLCLGIHLCQMLDAPLPPGDAKKVGKKVKAGACNAYQMEIMKRR